MGVLRRKSPLFRRKSSRNVSAIEAEVDYIVQRSPFLLETETRAQHEEVPASLPAFQRKEYQTGSLLGSGSFSKVHAIIGFKLYSSSSRRNSKNQQQLQQSASTCSSDGSSSQLAPVVNPEELRTNLTKSAFDDAGNAKYAVKFVKKELTKKSHAFRNAAADLIVEAKYLAALDHPNILKLRGIAQAGSNGFLDGHDGFFIIVDRLEETLGDRIQRWKEQPRCGDLLTVQANVALQMASALEYLHERRILFRDLKPTNVGFSCSDPNTVQLFDFGLCRELPATEDSYHDEDEQQVFQMSGAGTYRYMAPEIINTKRYNLKADIYSWAVVFHEMIALERPFDEFTVEEHKEFVCEIGQRPSLTDCDMPTCLQALLRQAWEQDPVERLTMRQVCQQLKPIVEALEAGETLPSHPAKWDRSNLSALPVPLLEAIRGVQ